jgi:hypothetical protein
MLIDFFRGESNGGFVCYIKKQENEHIAELAL